VNDCARNALRRAAIGLGLACLLTFVVIYAALISGGSAGPKQTDFVPYYAAGTLVVRGDTAHLYDRATLGRDERALVRPLHIPDGVMPWLYPTYFAVAIAPLALLPYSAAFLTWLLINGLLLVLVMVALGRRFGFSGSARLLWWVGGISFLPVLVCLGQGQTSILILGSLVGVFLLAETPMTRDEPALVPAPSAGSNKRGEIEPFRRLPLSHRKWERGLWGEGLYPDFLAGILLSLALIKPPYVAPLLLLFAVQRRWRLLGGFVLSVACLFALPVLVFGQSTLSGFVFTLTQASGWTTQIGGFQPQFNQSLSGLSHLLLSTSSAAILTVCLDGLVIGLFLLATRVQDSGLAFAAAIVCGPLVAPHVLIHDLALLLLPAAIAAAVAPRELRLWLILAAAYAAVIGGVPVAAVAHVQLFTVVMLVMLIRLAAPANALTRVWIMIPRRASIDPSIPPSLSNVKRSIHAQH
jgi:hypothetical protein